MVLYLGLDGGGTGCRAAICDHAGQLLGRGEGGPANINSDPQGATVSILAAATAAMVQAGATPADLVAVLDFFEARRGRLTGFRFRDPLDWRSCAYGGSPSALDQAIGVGDGVTTEFALVKRYGLGADAYVRSQRSAIHPDPCPAPRRAP